MDAKYCFVSASWATERRGKFFYQSRKNSWKALNRLQEQLDIFAYNEGMQSCIRCQKCHFRCEFGAPDFTAGRPPLVQKSSDVQVARSSRRGARKNLW